MNHHELYKSSREDWILKTFLSLLRKDSTKTSKGNPSLNEPDFIVQHECASIGIEVSEVYYSQDDAKENNQLRKGLDKIPTGETRDGKIPSLEEQVKNPNLTIDAIVVRRINERIQEKSAKRYKNISEAWLLLYLDLALFDDRDINLVKSRIRPKKGGFSRMFLLWANSAEKGGYSFYELGHETVE